MAGQELLAVIDVPAIRPKGITKRQWRLAALLPRCETAMEAMRLAGYSVSNVTQNVSRETRRVGVARAGEAIAMLQADNARGLMSIGIKALATADSDLKQLEPRERIAAGYKAVELAHSLGENVEQSGDGTAWQYRIRRACRLMARLTTARLLSPPPMQTLSAERQSIRNRQRSSY